MVSNHFRAPWSFSKLNPVASRRYLKQSMVHLMARHSSCPVEHGVSLRTGFLLTQTTGLFSSPSPCHHVPPIPLPEASVWVLKGTLKFSCICHHLYLFFDDLLGAPSLSFHCFPREWKHCYNMEASVAISFGTVWSRRRRLGTGNPLTALSSCSCTGSIFPRLHISCDFF